jgi:hypothetical protein
MAAQQQIVVAGQQIPIAVVVGANVYEHIAGPDLVPWMGEAGLVDEQLVGDTVVLFQDHGFDMPRAWANVRRQELIDLGIGPGYVSGLVDVMQTRMVQRCGASFVRLMEGSVQTDEEVATRLLTAKHAPVIPSVTVETGFAPTPCQWEDTLVRVAGWVRPTSRELAEAVQAIADNEAVDAAALAVAYGDIRSLALGTVMRGQMGLGGIEKLLSGEVLRRGCGLEMMHEISKTVQADLVEARLENWLHPVPVKEDFLVEAAVREWRKQQHQLLGKGRVAVQDPTLEKRSLTQLLASCPTFKPILTHLEKSRGSGPDYHPDSEQDSCRLW